MSPKTGRPKAEKPKDIRYSVRLDRETEKRLQVFCIKHEITRGEAIRKAIGMMLERE